VNRAGDPRAALTGRREAALLDLPSVARMAGVLLRRCADQLWLRQAVASIDRFATLTGATDLEALLAAARRDPTVAEAALDRLATAGPGRGGFAGLDLGPKLWFALNGIEVAWRPLPGPGAPVPLGGAAGRLHGAEQVALLGLIGSGLYLAELLRLRLGDLGILDAGGRVVPDLEAAPLAVAFTRRRGRAGDWVTFLSEPARLAVLDHVTARRAAGLGTGPEAPLLAGPGGLPATARTVRTARHRSDVLIRAGSALNVDLCRRTGEFFREWGLPGSRFVPHPTPTDQRSAV
jgi:hypothetical protein